MKKESDRSMAAATSAAAAPNVEQQQQQQQPIDDRQRFLLVRGVEVTRGDESEGGVEARPRFRFFFFLPSRDDL